VGWGGRERGWGGRAGRNHDKRVIEEKRCRRKRIIGRRYPQIEQI